MGIAASVNVDRENCEQFGDRVLVTKQLPVENFGQDNTESEGARNGSCQTGDKTFSSGSISEERFRERFTNRPSKSRKSLGSFLGLNYKLKGDEFERTNSDGTSYSAEAAELKIKRLTKKNSELQQEKERLKRELESFRKSSTRWQQESQQAKQYEEQAKERAKVFEDELEKVKKQSKSSCNKKEKEINILVRKIRELENNLKSGTSTDDSYNRSERLRTFENDTDVENLSLFKASGTIVDEKVPDFNTVFPLLAQVMTNLKPPNKNQTFRFFLSADKEAKRDATFFMKVLVPQLRQLCSENGKFFVMLESFETDCQSEEKDNKWDFYLMAKCDLFFGMTGNSDNRFILDKWKSSYNIFNTRRRPMFFCFKDANHNASGGTEVAHFLDGISEEAKVCFYTHPTSLVEENNEVIQEIVKEHFGLPGDVKGQFNIDISDEELISDCESSLKQLDILRMLTMSTDSEAGFSKYYKKLNEYVSGVGPYSPLLVSGAAGSGKTTLLAKWITKQLASGENLVLYNFVGSTTSDVFTNPAHVMRRNTSQLLGIFPCLCSMMHCDPVKCEEHFPRLLKLVPAKISKNIIIVIDAVDKLQNSGSTHLSWLNELLPATVRVILSVTAGNEPSHWRSWTTVNMSPLTVDESCDILVSCWRHPDTKLHNHEASELLNDLTESAITSPLFVTMLSNELSSVSSVTTSIQDYASFKNVIELTVSTLKSLQNSKGSLINQVLALVCCSRSGLAEAELMHMLSLQWSEWEPLLKCLVNDRRILREVNDLLVVSHEQELKAIYIHLNGEEILKQSRERLVKFYTDKLKNNGVSPSVIDQLPWLLVQLGDKENLKRLISRIDVFHMFIRRSLFSDLLGYWKYLDVDSLAFGKIYMDAIRKQEGDTPCLEAALRYEVLGRFLKGTDVFSLAMKCLERALETKEMVLEADDPWVGQSLHHLADLYVLLGNLESAEASYKQTLEINENTFGKDHPLVAKELECLAYVKKKQNKEKACTELQRKAARIRRKSTFPKLSTSSHSLDCRLIQVSKLGAGRKTPETASSLHNVGVLLMVEKRYQDAETLFKKSLAMRESLFGENDLVVTQSLDRLASLYYDQKMYSEAITYHKKSLDIKREKLEKGDPNLISTMNCLAITLRKKGNLESCECSYKEVLMVLKEKLDSKDPAIATALHNLAVVNSDQKKLSEALKLFEQALDIYEERLGESHPKVAETLRNIAKVHLDLGNADVASSYLLRSQMIPDENSTMTTCSSLNSYGSVSWTSNSTQELQDR